MKAVICSLIYDRITPISKIIARLKDDDPKKMKDNCFMALRQYVTRATGKAKRHVGEMVKSMLSLFSARSRHSFALDVIRSQILGEI